MEQYYGRHHTGRPDDQGPIQILTGGNPRLLAIIAGLRKSFRSLLDGFVALLDDHTEYFRGRIATLPTIERRVYLAVAESSAFVSPRVIAARARADIRTTSAMLGRLVARGMIGFRGSTKKREYRVTESIVALYYTARRTGGVGAIVRALLDIMPAIYPRKTREDITNMVAAELPTLELTTGQVDVIRRVLQGDQVGRDGPAWWLLETAGAPPTSPVDVGVDNDAPPEVGRRRCVARPSCELYQRRGKSRNLRSGHRTVRTCSSGARRCRGSI